MLLLSNIPHLINATSRIHYNRLTVLHGVISKSIGKDADLSLGLAPNCLVALGGINPRASSGSCGLDLIWRRMRRSVALRKLRALPLPKTTLFLLSAKVLANVADTSLFKAVLLNENHSLRCLFPKQHFTPISSGSDHITLTFLTKTHETLYHACYSLTLTKLLASYCIMLSSVLSMYTYSVMPVVNTINEYMIGLYE